MVSKSKRKIKGSAHASPETRLKEILNAAVTCFARDGYNGTTIDQIAAETGLSKGSVYRFFKSKDDILLALLDRLEQEAIQKSDHLIEKDHSPISQIRTHLRTMFEVSEEYASLQNLWLEVYAHDLARARLKLMITEARQEIVEVLRPVAATAETEAQLLAVSDVLLSFHEGLLLLSTLEDETDMLSRFDQAWPVLETMLKQYFPPASAGH